MNITNNPMSKHTSFFMTYCHGLLCFMMAIGDNQVGPYFTVQIIGHLPLVNYNPWEGLLKIELAVILLLG